METQSLYLQDGAIVSPAVYTASQCNACEATFGRIRRRPKTCTECGRRFCKKCLEDTGRCGGCTVSAQLGGLIDWASADSSSPTAAFDREAALEFLGRLSCRPMLRESILARRKRRPARRGGVPGQAVEMDDIDPELGQPAPCGAPENAIAEWGPGLLRLDPELALMRFGMVPRLVSEEAFWDGCFSEAAAGLRELFASGMSQAGLVATMEEGLVQAYTRSNSTLEDA